MVTIAKKNNQLIIENIGEFCDIDYTHFCSVIDYFITCKRLIIDYLKKKHVNVHGSELII